MSHRPVLLFGTQIDSGPDPLDSIQTPEDMKGRFEFVGHLAPKDVRCRYINISVPVYLEKGSQNPYRYFNY